MSFLVLTLAGIIGIVLLLADGFIFGIAVKKGISSVILIILGLLLAAFIGLAIPFLSVSGIWTHMVDVIISVASHIGALIYVFPISLIIGFALGLWQG